MDIADSSQTKGRFDKLNSARRVLLERLRALLPERWLVLLMGIGCLIYGQYMMEQRFIQQANPAADNWNSLYHLEIVNLPNVLAGLPYFAAGLILCAWVALPASWKEGFVNWSSQWPAFRTANWSGQIPRLLAAVALMAYLLAQLGKHNYTPIYPFLWLLALWLCTLVFWHFDRRQEVNLSLELHTADVLWLLGLLVVGIGIGAYALRDIPAIMIQDEGSFWENALAVALGQFRPAFFDSGVYTFPIASTIYQGWMMRLFGIDVWGWRFSSVLAGVLTVIPLYLLGKEWFGRRVGVVSALLMLANPYFLSFARLGYNNSQALLPVTLAVYLWTIGARKGSYFYLWLAGLVAGLGFYTYSAVWIGMVTLCLGILYLRVLKQISWKQTFLVFGLLLLAWGLAFAPRVAYTMAGDQKEGLSYKILETSFVNVFYAQAYYSNTDTITTIERPGYPTIFFDPVLYGKLLLRGLVRTLLALFDPLLVTEHFLISGLAGVITPIFFAIGLVFFLRMWKQSRFGLPLIWLVSGLIFLSIIGAFPPRHTHMVSLIPVIALIAGVGLCTLVEALTEYLPASVSAFRVAIISASIAAIALGIFYSGAKKYFLTMPETYPPAFEDFVSWVALRTEKPVEIVYLGSINVIHRVAYLVSTQMVPHMYVSLDRDTFSPQQYLLKPANPTVVFCEIGGMQDCSYLQQLPKGFGAPVPVRDRAGNVWGYVTTNTAGVPLEWKAGASSGWSSLTGTPARNVLILLLLAMLLVGGFSLRKRFSWPRLSFQAGAQTQEETSHTIEKSEAFDVEFSFRIRLSPRKRNGS